MFKFAANLTFLFTEFDFLERFSAAQKAGFKYVEFMFPYEFDQAEISKQLDRHNLKMVLFNIPAGDWAGGDRGIAVDPARKNEFRDGVKEAISSAQRFNVKQVNCLVGNTNESESADALWNNLVDNIRFAADELKAHGVNLLIEPINHHDMPGFYLNTTDQVMKLISEVKKDNVYLQYDVYHAEREKEDHLAILKDKLHKVGHIQIADNPGRNQPGTGVIDYTSLFKTIAESNYNGYIAMEYKPDPNTEASLEWVAKFGYKL